MNITRKEKQSLKSLLPLCLKLPKNWDDGSGIRQYDNNAEIIERLFQDRGIKRKFYNTCFASFQSIGMHVDSINPVGCETLIVPIRGVGHLHHFVNGKIQTTNFHPLSSYFWRMIRLDDTKPHSFITKGTCHALLIGVSKKDLDLFEAAGIINVK